MNHPEPVPPETPATPYHCDGVLYLPDQAELPTDTCICSGRPPFKVVTKALRSPTNPMTWYTRQPCVAIGLSKKHYDENNVGIALTLSSLVIGVAILIAGIVTMEWASLIIGFIAIAISGFFRARGPIYSKAPNSEPIPIQGAHKRYLEQFPEYPE